MADSPPYKIRRESPLFGTEPTFKRPRDGIGERAQLADHGPMMIA
jgi:hypothetical protein